MTKEVGGDGGDGGGSAGQRRYLLPQMGVETHRHHPNPREARPRSPVVERTPPYIEPAWVRHRDAVAFPAPVYWLHDPAPLPRLRLADGGHPLLRVSPRAGT